VQRRSWLPLLLAPTSAVLHYSFFDGPSHKQTEEPKKEQWGVPPPVYRALPHPSASRPPSPLPKQRPVPQIPGVSGWKQRLLRMIARQL
jgi:hypothetical protein